MVNAWVMFEHYELLQFILLNCCMALFVCVQHTEGSHTLSKTVVKSVTGGLAAFAKVKATCIGCKALLPGGSECLSHYCTHVSTYLKAALKYVFV